MQSTPFTAEELAIAREVDALCNMVFLGDDVFLRIKTELLVVACDVDPAHARRAAMLATLDGDIGRKFQRVQAMRAARAAERAIAEIMEATQ